MIFGIHLFEWVFGIITLWAVYEFHLMLKENDKLNNKE